MVALEIVPSPFQVTCHSGHSYADRPTSFTWNGARYDIDGIEREWLEPGEKHFIVQATKAGKPYGEKRFDICYYTQEDTWQLKEIS